MIYTREVFFKAVPSRPFSRYRGIGGLPIKFGEGAGGASEKVWVMW